MAVDHCDGAISGTPASIPAVKLLAGATDADSDPLTLASVSAASTNGGTVVITGTNVTYTPVGGFIGLPCHDYTLLRSLVPQGPFTPLLTMTAPASGLIEHLDTTPLTNIGTVMSYTDTDNVTHFRTNPPYSSVFFRMVTQP